MNTEISKKLKSNIENEISSSHKEFEGFGTGSNENYLSFNNLEGTFINAYGCNDRSTMWVFDKFEWFPEGIYGEIISFFNGGDDFDYEVIGERRKFLLIGNKLDEMRIDIQGQGWRDLKKTDLYKVFKDYLSK